RRPPAPGPRRPPRGRPPPPRPPRRPRRPRPRSPRRRPRRARRRRPRPRPPGRRPPPRPGPPRPPARRRPPSRRHPPPSPAPSPPPRPPRRDRPFRIGGMATDPFAAVSAVDPELADVLARELVRQNTTIQLIASENFTSKAVMAAQGTVLTNKYSEGYPGKRYYGGNYVVDDAEELARRRVCALFGADHANVQPHSGANANMGVYLALLEPGDKVMGMRLDQGGHLTHGSPVNFSGRLYEFVAYGVDPDSEVLDYDAVRDIARAERPKAIIAGATAYPRVIDFPAFRSIADEVGALLIVDAAHIAGLIAGGAHPSPVPSADVVTFTTHKTMRGPRGGAILCREEYAKAIDKAVFPGMQGGPLMHVIAAKAVCFHEAAQPAFKDYAAGIVRNSRALAAALAGEGFRIVSGG